MQLSKKQCTTTLNSVITIIRKMQLVNFMPDDSNRFGQKKSDKRVIFFEEKPPMKRFTSKLFGR